MNNAKLIAAKDEFKRRFPGVSVGMVPGKGLVVRLPEQIDGVPIIEVSLVGEGTMQTKPEQHNRRGALDPKGKPKRRKTS